MFKIKICGITNLEDAQTAERAGADAVGLNFFERSPRCVAADTAQQIVRELDGLVACWGVFVNMSLGDVLAHFAHVQLDGVQLHGDEPPEMVAQLGRRLEALHVDEPPGIVRACRLGDGGLAAVRADLEACRSAGMTPNAVLLDAAHAGLYGGTGQKLAWNGLIDYRNSLGDTPLVLAGGLTPENVAEAIRVVRPHGVDVASGVESSPGKKDPAKVRDFVAAARTAFAAM